MIQDIYFCTNVKKIISIMQQIYMKNIAYVKMQNNLTQMINKLK